MSKHNDLGRHGEKLASVYLQEKGHLILETNFRFDHKEIDIISLDEDVLVFTEIKARSHYAFGYPEEAVTPRKQSLLKLAAEYYCLDKPHYLKMRFDVISILLKENKAVEIMHFEDAFY